MFTGTPAETLYRQSPQYQDKSDEGRGMNFLAYQEMDEK